MPPNRIAFVIAALMFAASAGAIVARPDTKVADLGPPISLETMVPKQFGDWREEPQRVIQMVNPQTQELLASSTARCWSVHIMTGDRVMLPCVFMRDHAALCRLQSGGLLSAQGFTRANRGSQLATPFGAIPAPSPFPTLGRARRPVTYVGSPSRHVGAGKLQTLWTCVTG